MQFDSWFKTATGSEPYAYQQRFVELAEWPDAVEVPTGAGKTAAVVLGWLWRRRFAAPQVRARTPRRLVICLPMRVLSRQTHTAAYGWIQNLGLAGEVSTHLLIGGSVDDVWLANPERDLILIGTQDLLLSRAMNRGYAMHRNAWPLAFGLLNNDVQWVFDEVQLMGVAASTSAQLDAFRRALGVHGPSHSLWVSATLGKSRLQTVDRRNEPSVFVLTDHDRGELATRLTASKRLREAQVDGDNITKLAKYVADQHVRGSRTLVVVNTVRRAQDVYSAIRKLATSKAGTALKDQSLALLHSRYRAHDRQKIESQILAAEWHGILISTQVVEAGLDWSARTLITDLAPWSSFVQRAGRCNRNGEHAEADICWVDRQSKNAAPYEPIALTESRTYLKRLKDASPETLRNIETEPAPVILPVIRRRDIIDLFDTSADLSGADIDVAPFIRGDDNTDVYVAWRALGKDSKEPPTDSTEPSSNELCAVPIGNAVELLKAINRQAWRWDHRIDGWIRVERAVPGHVWIVDAAVGHYDPEIGFKADIDDAVPPVDADDAVTRAAWEKSAAQTLVVHTRHVLQAIQTIVASLPSLPREVHAALERAALWHDVGKAHPVFQQMVKGNVEKPFMAKSDSTSRRPSERPGFRHEVVSALALLRADSAVSLAAYLVAAHHGRARVVVKSPPGEKPPKPSTRFMLGVCDGDVMPAVNIGVECNSPEFVLDVGVFQLGGDGSQPGWTAAATRLRDQFGPFRLSYLEALLRAADWRGSAAKTELVDV